MDKLNKKIELSDQEIEKYLTEIAKNDENDNAQSIEIEDLEHKLIALKKVKKWNTHYKEMKEELENRMEIDPDVTQISLTDPDARSIVLNNSGHSDVAYNIVTTVDEKHCLIASFDTHNVKDSSLLAQSLIECKAELDNDFKPNLYDDKEVFFQKNEKKQVESEENEEKAIGIVDYLATKHDPSKPINGLADKGFHAIKEIQQCIENEVITYVAIPNPAFSGKDKDFTVHNFDYDKTNDQYTCPEGKIATTSGKSYNKKNRKGQIYQRFKYYRVSFDICKDCPFKDKCLSAADLKQHHGRKIERLENQDAADQNRARVNTKEGKAIYKTRQAIVEHPFGTIKRQWDCYYTLLRRREKVNAEFAIVFTCYNLRRAVSILPVSELLSKLKVAKNLASALLNSLFEPFFKQRLISITFLLYICKRSVNRRSGVGAIPWRAVFG